MRNAPSQGMVTSRALVSQAGANTEKPTKTPALVQSAVLAAPNIPTLPFMNATDLPDPGSQLHLY